MKRALLNLLRVVMSIRHILPVFLLTLASLNTKAECPASVTATPALANICAGDSVLMECTDLAASTFQWYKDGVIMADSTKRTCYAREAGSYTVTTDLCATPSTPVVVSIKPLPILSIATSSTYLCSGQQVTLTVSQGLNVVWAWIAPIANAWTSTNPLTVTLTAPTTFQLVGANQITQCANTVAVTVNVIPPLVPGTLHSNSQVCPGGTPPLITSTPATGASGSYTYQWQMSTTSATAGFTNIPGANSPTYQPPATFVTTWYRMVVSSPPCDPRNSNAVVVQVDNIPVVTSAPTKAICTGDNVNYNPTSNVANATYTWTASVTSGNVSGFTASGSGPIQDVLVIMPLGSANQGQVTYVITPTGPATSFCVGTPPFNLVVTVYPIALVTNPLLSQDICSGTTTTPVILQSNIPTATFSWTAVGAAGLSGYLASGTGNIPAMTISGLLSAIGTVNYTITPHMPSGTCPTGPSVVYTINVKPAPSVTNSPMQQTICTGDKTSLVTLISNIPATTFIWAATASATTVTGFQANGTNTIPIQTITNTANIQGTVTYHIVPNTGTNGCAGIPADYVVKINPEPVLTVPQFTYTLCSGNTINIPLSSNVAGTQYSWTANSGGVITGGSDQLVPISTTAISQTLSNISNANHNITYVITPTSNGCVGNPVTVVVTVTPEQVLTIVPASPVTCSGSNVVITLLGNDPAITFTWTASTTGNVTGFSPTGSGPTISETLINHDNITRTVVYAVTMDLNGCTSGVTNFNVTVYPTAAITNNPLVSSLCSGSTFNLALSSSVWGSTFSWTANSISGVTGYSSGNGSTINQLISNSTSAPANVVYTITPSANGCTGTPSDYTLTINPIPDVNLSLSTQSICSGTATTQVDLSSAVAGTTYSWTAVPSGGGITGYLSSGTTAFIPTQIISSTLNTQSTVTYSVIPTFIGCAGPAASHITTINPIPQVINGTMSQTICTGATSANVTLLSSVVGTSFTWIATASSGAITGFLSNGGNTIPEQTIFNSATTPGTVTYQIIPTSNYSPACPGTPATYTITISPSPTVTSNLNEAVCSGQPFTYNITADLPGTTFTWSRAAVSGINNSAAFGTSDNFTETLINPTLIDIDVYYVITPKSQSPSLCTGIPVTLTVKVRALPQVDAGSDFTIPYGIYTSLTGVTSGGTGALSPTWTPNTYIASGANTLTPQTTNLTLTRTYTLTVDDAAGCSASNEMMVIVVGTPLAAVPISSPTDVCFGTNAIINANATGGSGSYTYSWTSIPAGFTSTSSTIIVTPLVSTQYILTVSDGFNTASASVTTTVNPLPLNFVLTGGGSYCIGGPGVVVGLAGSQTGVEYQLFNNGNPVGIPVAGNDASISFGNQTLAGIYTVKATRVSTSCTQGMSSTVAVSINGLPVSDAGADQNIPFGTSTLLNGSVSGGFGIMSYAWYPSAFIASGINTSSAFTTNLYSNTTFTLEVTDANGCKGTDDMIVSLDGNAISVSTNSNPAQICADASLAQLNATVTGGTGVYTYLWTSIPAGSPAWTSTEQNPLVSPDVNTIYTVTVNDGFNSAIASATVVVNPLPLEYSVTGSNSYCYAGTGVTIGLSGSQPNTNYQLFRGGIADGPAVTGDGNPISFGNRTAAFTYEVVATNNITACTNQMTGSATIVILPPPPAFLVTGGGSYPIGGPGRVIGLMHGDAGISYQLYCENLPVGSPITGTESTVDFGLQTQQGTYTVVATDLVTGCTANMTGSVEITILAAPSIFDVTGGGVICEGEPGLMVGLSGSEAGMDYQLIFDGFPMGALQAGTNSHLFWGPFTTSGLYEVRAINPIFGTTLMMDDSAVIIVNPLPTIFTINPTGSQCPGTIIRLNGSDFGITYSLLLNGVTVDTQTGTGIIEFLDFGARYMTGTYTIKAVNPITGCEAMMNGNTFINIPPQIYNVIPAGILCPGQEIRLSGTESGINYQLRWNGTFDLGAPVSGTGSDILMGNAGLPGIYSVVAIDATTNCVSYMNDSATLYPDPAAFSIVPNGAACEGDLIGQNGSELGVDYVLLLDNAIHLDTISGTGLPISFGTQSTAGNYTILAIDQFSYCQFTMNGTTLMNDSPIKYSILPAGLQCIGNTVSLSNSQSGVTYQLMLDGLYNIGLPVAGTGTAISFGPQDLNGTYTVRGVNDITGCNSIMADSTIFEPLPLVFNTIPLGSHCAGTIVGIDGSEINFNYILIFDGAINLDTIAGTGNAVDFGAQVTAGTYSVIAYNTVSFCSSPMNSNSVIEASPVAFNMTPAGNACIGALLGIEDSEAGITYQLRWNGSINVGAPVSGTGSAISFGSHNLTGTYSVIATNGNGCVTTMSSTVVINPLPVAFNLFPSGIQCQGTSLGMDGSEVNVNYILVRNGNVLVDTIAGTGNTISFGPQLTSGNYSVIAYFTATSCQSAMNGASVISNIAPTIYTMTPAGLICAGANIGIDNSEIGAFYQLRINGTINMGTPIAGTGSAISFGVQTVSGIYTAIATNANGCNSLMTGNVEVNPNPIAYTITPSGVRCPGTAIGTDGSETGVNYILVLDGAINIDTLAGNGSPLSFGIQTTSGSYEVIAYNATTLCQTMMNGNTILNPAPIAFNLTPSGIFCTGTTIGIDNSETGVLYQLRRNGAINIGTQVAGTGSAIDFGIQTLPGTYTVEAAGSNGCTSMMNASVVINPNPLVFTELPAGNQCPGTSITLNGSETGMNYVLLRDGIFHMDTLAGTGSPISFGAQMIAGTYLVVAFSSAASCPALMNGVTSILVGPTAFNVTPAGIICSETTIGLDDSEPGVSYLLRRDGTTNVGTAVAGTGSAISFGTVNIAGSYSIIAINNVNGCATIMDGNAVLQPMPLAFSITEPGTQCAGTSVILNGSQIGIDYVLVQDNIFNIDTISGTGSVLDFGPQSVTGSYTVKAISGATTCQTLMNGSTLIMALPTAFNITPAGLTCGTAIIGLDGSENGMNYTLFKNGINTGITISGTGNAISFGTQTYGNYTIKAVNVISNCNLFIPGTIQISKPAIVNSGSDVTICSIQPVFVSGTVSNGGTTKWSTSGDGAFSTTNTLSAIYTPGNSDLEAGSVYLMLTTTGIGSCATTQVIDTMKVTLDHFATADAGGNQDVCVAGPYTVNDASATNFNSVSWSTSGTGTLSQSNTLTPSYTPSASDISTGSVSLTLHVTGKSPCSNTTEDVTILTFHPAISVEAGPDATINYGDTYVASDASVQNSASVQWTSSGSGTFNNSNFLNSTYTPSNADFAKGSVVLSLSTINNAPCAEAVDILTLNLTNNWAVEFTWGATCEAQPVAFSVNTVSTNVNAVASWLWNFGDGNTSTQMNPTHLFPAVGGYTVTLTAIDTLGKVRLISHQITVSQYPVAFFKNSVPDCSNELMHFTDLAHTLYGYIAEWIWNYGDGSANDTIHFPDEPNISHLFNVAGTFNVTLTVTNSYGCVSSVTIPVDVIEAPVANFQYNDDCSGLETAFRDASYANGPGNTIEYLWDFGDPSTGSNNYSDLEDATHTFSAPGTYQVMHVVRNFNNCTDTIVKPVIIQTPVPVDFVHSFTCIDGKANFGPDTSAMNVADITSWTWNFGDGVTNNQEYTNHVYAAAGSYEVKLTVISLSGCTASKTRTVVVNPLPVAMFDAALISCENASVHFDDLSTTYAGFISEWNWDFGDGNTKQILYPANSSTEHSYSAPGTYIVKLGIVSSDSCTAEYSKTIIINPAPTANFEATNTCQGTQVQFNDLTQTSGAGIITGWNWNFGDGASGGNNVSTLQNPEHQYASTGSYQVELTISTASGCATSIIKTVVITDAPFVDFSFDNHCAATIIQFNHASGIDDATISLWDWSFGDGLTSALADPQHMYSTPGEYIVTLTITNTSGCTNTNSHNITILPVPVAKFSIDAPACSKYKVAFTDQSSASIGYIMRWEYNFGDGKSAVINHPENPSISHTYDTYGTYTATLTVVTNDSCSATISKSIQILPSPLANFDFNATCLEIPVQFNDLSQGSLISWTWDFNDPGSLVNNSSNQQNPVHLFGQAGDYLVTLFVQNANGCHDTVTRTISISPKPEVDFSFNTGCAADTVHFNSSAFVNASSTASWEWQFGDNSTSVDADPSHIYTSPGTYSVSLTVTNQNGCTNVKTRQVQVTTAPIAMFTPNLLSCSGTAVLFTDLSSTPNGIINSWNWNFDDGNEVTLQAPSNGNATHTYSVAGIYHVTLTIHTTTGCEASYTAAITVNSAPVSAFSFASSCSALPTSFTDQSQGSDGYSIIGWSWNFGDPASGSSNISVLQNPQHLFTSNGLYNVTLTTENVLGCTNTVTQILNITSGPAVDFTLSSSCSNTPTTFNVDANITNIAEIASYLWDFGDGTSTSAAAEPTHVYSQAGYYIVTLTITNTAGCTNISSHSVQIQASPSAQFTYSGNCASNLVKFTDKSYNISGEKTVAWAWDFGVGTTTSDISAEQNPSYTYSEAGIYNVTLTVTSASGCTSSRVIPVTIMAAPQAQFSYLAEPCHNGAVIFKDESVSTPQAIITGWYWEFAPGVYSTSQNPSYIFGTSDTCYDVKLTVTTSNGCTNTQTQKVCIPPGIQLAINYTQACFGETTWFSSALIQPVGGSITSYSWDFGDPATDFNNQSKLANPEHTFSKPGPYYISLKATDINGCSTIKYMNVNVDLLPNADFSYDGGECDSLVNFKDLTFGINIIRWTWEFGDGKSKTVDFPESPNVTHYYTYPGVYPVTLIAQSEAGCIDTIIKTIRRTPCIAAAFKVSDPVVCVKRTMKFTESSTCQAPIASWTWYFGDNTSATFTSPQQNVQHTYSVPGNYTVKMVVATQMVGGLATDTASNQVAVKPAASAAYQWQDVCVGSSTTFDNQTQDNNTTIKSYQWNFGDPGTTADTTSAKQAEYRYDVYGAYDVKLVVTNTLGCTDTIINKVNIFESPAADFIWKNNCEAKPVSFIDQSVATSSALVDWNWRFKSDSVVLEGSNQQNCTYKFAHAGTYDAYMMVTDKNGCSTTIVKQVTINTNPVAAFDIIENYEDIQGQIMLNNGTIDGTSYEWNVSDGKISFGTNPVITFDKEGHYTIQLTALNEKSCTDTLSMSYDLMYKGLYVPNAFNPGNIDANVAEFKPKGMNLMMYNIGVYDQWGNQLWSSNKLDSKGSPTEAWDGTVHGKLLQQDVYVWKVQAQFNDGKVWDGHNAGNNDNMPQKTSGTVTLIR
ncbi:MAG: PKD domain-containing protein [Bacteroidales bacterium]|nr:PKD domain-containing protein [Bacteroidales bacterium]